MRIFRTILIGCLFLSGLPAFSEECPYLAAQLENYKKGQDINKFIKYDCLMDNAKWQTKETPLGWAVGGMNKCNGNYDAVEAILEKRPDLATSMDYDNRWAIISHSITSCCGNYNEPKCGPNPQYKIAKLLIENGADINAQTRNVFENKDLKGKFIKNKQGTLLDVVRMHIEHCSDSTETCKQIEQLLLQHNAIATWSNIDAPTAPPTNTGNGSTGTGEKTTPPRAPTTPGTIVANATNKTLTYNGNAQSCKNVSGLNPSDATVTYSTSENGTYTSDITMTNAGTMQVWYKITKENYTTKTGHYDCVMNKANGLIDVKNGSTKLAKNTTITSSSLTDTKTLTINCPENSNPNVNNSNPSVAKATINANTITLTPLSPGVTNITVLCNATQNYNASDLSFTYAVDDPSAHTITATVTDKTLTYNGKAQSCANVSNVSPSDAKVTYSTKENGTYKNDVTLTKVGSSTIYYKIEKQNYTTLKGSYTCTIQEQAKKEIIVDEKNWVNKYDGKTHLCPIFVTEPKNNNTVKIRYKTKSSSKYDQTNSPAVKNVEDSKTVYYQVTATGYTTKTGQYECTITRIPGNTTIKDGSTEIKQNANISIEFPNPGTKNLTVICSENANPEQVIVSSTDIATATLNGKQLTLTGIAQGTTDITVKCPQVKNHEASEIKFTLQTISNVGKINVSGVVLDAREPHDPVPYVNVVPVDENKQILRSNFGTTTNLDGKFTLKNVPENAQLRITYVGYTEQFVKPAQNLTIYFEYGTTLPPVVVSAEHKNGDPCCVKTTMDAETLARADCGHITKGQWYKRNNEWVCLAIECDPGYFVNPNKECEAEHHNESDACEDMVNHIKSGKWHQRGPNDWICVPDACTPEYYKLTGEGFNKQCKSEHDVGDKCDKNTEGVDKHIEDGYWTWNTDTKQWVCSATKCTPPYKLTDFKCVLPQAAPRPESKQAPTVFEEMDDIFKKHKDFFDSSSVWKDDEGGFNTARLISDSVAGVVLGTVGGVVTSNIIKKNQLKKGFENLKCTIGGQNVADYGDQFNVDIKRY